MSLEPAKPTKSVATSICGYRGSKIRELAWRRFFAACVEVESRTCRQVCHGAFNATNAAELVAGVRHHRVVDVARRIHLAHHAEVDVGRAGECFSSRWLLVTDQPVGQAELLLGHA